MTATLNAMQCPKCGSFDLYDNRQENAERLARGEKARPMFKCKNRACDWTQWPPKNSAPPVAPVPQKQVAPPTAYVGDLPGDPGAVDFATICKRYRECVGYVVKNVLPALAEDEHATFSPESISSMAATIFIARTKAGV